MNMSQLLKLGDPQLYLASLPVDKSEIEAVNEIVSILDGVLMEFRQKYGFGRAIAAPQIGVLKRIIYININQPLVIINPVLTDFSEEIMEVWDNCLCFPNLRVKVARHRSCWLTYYNLDWEEQSLLYHNDMAELIQHEFDHLEGILAVQRAINNKSLMCADEYVKQNILNING